MKLKHRFVCVVTFTVIGLLGLHVVLFTGLPNLIPIDPVVRNDAVVGLRDISVGEHPHLRAGRKRLNKSNFTSDADFADANGTLPKSPRGEITHGRDNGQSFVASEPKTGEKDVLRNFKNTKVDKMLLLLTEKSRKKFDLSKFDSLDYLFFLKSLTSRLRKNRNTLPVYHNYKGDTNWERFHLGINQYSLYSPDDSSISSLLKDMNRMPIVDVDMKEGGTQLKLIITFEDEGQALMKPMRYPRSQETLPNHFYFVDYERHNAEIAAFHLDRALGFYRVPPTTGRLLNMTTEIKKFADRKLAKTFFYSPAGNLCFHGSCSYYCDTSHAICGHPDTLEVSMATFLPPEEVANRKTWRNPWKRSYSKHRKAYWEVYDDLCDKVRERPPYNQGRRLLDLMDITIFDFIIGNMDRHHYETFIDFGNDTYPIHMDHGRGFGKPNHDEMSIMAPVLQCCLIRYSTFIKLVKLYRGPQTLSDVFESFASQETIAPILTKPHLTAMNRRVAIILQVVDKCLEDNSVDEVIVDDHI
ncbi:extracellular serine/threonine protein CG31145 [Patella vulgata]|uniref:extracellular serine/threonine protein CG31145 n=1 Tax=Patella vulgata TaxID=6465 RepID=UPI00217F27F8|nr:extracellular serine/threonine protein CG31145 [Patella vulgata]XP_050391454.1 extracellular serine/threonine protein CG31145 [Patella vulgata]XP_050391455.1 extracellular serine/threonine protein CG31145 [Patella vulgata]XP_050391456.1 extracellular serine/threonine protein CG31145 [Patella vulgata]XP_050391458.1 extracellular serine/threonine protein CG31145 [Patella vulgata]